MPHKQPRIAIAYDFDGTLSPGNMQEHSFLPKIKISPTKFWSEVEQVAKNNDADAVLTYMNLMLRKASEADVPIRKRDFIDHGKSVKLFRGVSTWFNRINNYAIKRDLKVEHYIISSGIQEMILGTAIATEFKRIYASSYLYNSNEVAQWPALAINFTTKTQYLFRINKGALDVYDNKKINQFIPMNERPIPFPNIIFIGDGATDIPCFSLVKSLGGNSIAVYKPKTKGAKAKAQKLVEDGRVNFISPADYSNKSEMFSIVKAIIDKIACDAMLEALGKQE